MQGGVEDEGRIDRKEEEEDVGEREDQTFQDGTLDDETIPSPGGPRGRSSPDWPEPE